MSRDRVEERAQMIYVYLKARLNQPLTIGQLLQGTGLRDSATTRSGIRRARDHAERDGLCFPVACPANGFSYTVTDDPSAAFDPSLHLGRLAQGIGVRKDVHDDFIRARMSKLTQSERAMFHATEKYEQAQRASREAYQEITKALVGLRRESRSELTS